jgi:hypothetical protein
VSCGAAKLRLSRPEAPPPHGAEKKRAMTLSHVIASALNVVGLMIVLAGSVVAAFAVILKPRDAIRIAGQSGATGWGAGVKPLPDETYLQQPAVQNLILQSKKAKCGLLLIAAGTFFQIVGGVLVGFGY